MENYKFITLVSGKEIGIDLRNKRSITLAYLSANFPGSAKASILRVNTISFQSKNALLENDLRRIYISGHTLTLIKFPHSKMSMITLNEQYLLLNPLKMILTYHKAEVDQFSKEIELAYQVE